MKQVFDELSIEENAILMEALPDITLLIAAADGDISGAELDWGRELANIRSFKSSRQLEDFYKEATLHFEANLRHDFTEGHANSEEITAITTEHLAKIGPILKKLDKKKAIDLLDSFRSFAKHIAQSDGGFLRFGSISAMEKKLIDLPMIDF